MPDLRPLDLPILTAAGFIMELANPPRTHVFRFNCPSYEPLKC